MLKEIARGVLLPVKVLPNSHCNEIIGWELEELKIRISAAPEKGNANDALLRFLAKFFKISRSSVTLLSGSTSRHKRVHLTGISLEAAASALSLAISNKKNRS